jgi:predicted dehydrogenase
VLCGLDHQRGRLTWEGEEDGFSVLRAEIEDFQRAVATGGQPAATGLDGLRVVEVTLAMIESARTRRSVKIERVEP